MLFLRKKNELRLLFEAFLISFFLFLFLSFEGGLKFFAFLFLFYFLIKTYFRYAPRISYFRFSFLILLVFVFLVFNLINFSGLFLNLILSLFYFVFLSILLKIITFGFKNENSVYNFFQLLLLLFLFLIYFYWWFSFSGFYNFLWRFSFLLMLFLLNYEFFKNQFYVYFDFKNRLRVLTLSLVFAFLGFQTAFLVGFLPLGFISSACLMTLIFGLSRNLFQNYLKGTLDLVLSLEIITIFVIFLMILAVTTLMIFRYL